MNDILHDLSPSSLAGAIEKNLSYWIPVLGKMGKSIDNDPPGVCRAASEITLALFNSIMDARLTPENVAATVDYLVSDAKKRKVPLLWWVGPSSLPTNLATYLEEGGFTIDDNGPGMAVELANLNENLPAPQGLSLAVAHNDDSLWTWCQTMAAGFGIPNSRLEYVVKVWHDFITRIDPEIATAYTAWLDDKPVATSLLFIGGGVAGIYAVATIPEARRKGIGARITLQPLLEARERGYKAGILQASEMGEGVYRSLGFKEYCRIRSYRFQP